MKLTDAHVLITGASRGIGQALAGQFAEAGSRVTLVARSADRIDELAGELGGAAVPADLTDPAALSGLIARVEEEHGPLDVLVNNAGRLPIGAIMDLDQADVDATVRLNLPAPIELCRQALPGMIERGRGHVANISSTAGVGCWPGIAAYCGTKAGLTHFTAGLRADLRGLPIGTTVVEVHVVPTRMGEQLLEYGPAAASDRRMRRLGILPHVTLEKLARHTVKAVANNRRHLRLPRRAAFIAGLSEAPRRSTEWMIAGVPARE